MLASVPAYFVNAKVSGSNSYSGQPRLISHNVNIISEDS